MKINLQQCREMQKLTGWGTSACWWSQYCADEKTQNEIIDLLYTKNGLNLNIYRYNIGGGTDESNCRVENPWRKTESFLMYNREEEKSRWDFSKDKNAVKLMKKAVATGNVDTLILFCNSPHYSLTGSGQASGSFIGHTCNLPKMNYGRFADYVLDVASHFIDCGLPVKYVSPVNEPQWCWGGSNVWQEGCHYEPEELAEIYHIFAEKIISRRIPVMLYAAESGCMLENTADYVKIIVKDKTIMQVTDVFAYHSYHDDDKPSSRYTFKKSIVKKYPKLRFDMSEWCELPNKSHTKNFKGALITARIIGQDLIYGGASSWTSWVAVNQFSIKEDGYDYSDGLITAADDFSSWQVAERYYGFAHFSKYVPVGSTALDFGFKPTDGKNSFNVFAFKTPVSKTVLVIVNEGRKRNAEIAGNYSSMQVIMSNQTEKLKTVYSGVFNNTVACESNSITTILLN